MNRRVAQLTHHTLADRIVAIVVAWLITATTIPAGGLSLTETGGLGRPMLHTVFASLPAAIPRTEEPAPAPTPDPPDDTRDADKWGEITVGQPKIWQYERVNSLLDGLLRDVQGVSMSDLIGLDPNATNGAAVKFVQSMLEIGVKHDQGAAVTNSIALQNFAASQSVASAQIEANKTYLQQLYVQRTNITNQMAAAMQLNTTLQGQLSATDPTTTAYQSLTTQQKAAASQVTSLQSDLSSINSQITAASSTTLPAAPSLASTSAGNPPESASTFSSFLGNLPSDLTKNLVL